MPTSARLLAVPLLVLLVLSGCAVRRPDPAALQQRLVAQVEATARAAPGVVRLDPQGQLSYAEDYFQDRHRGFIAVMRDSWEVAFAGTCLRPEPAHDHQACVAANTSQLETNLTAIGISDPLIRRQASEQCLLRGWTVVQTGPERVDAATARMLVPCALVSLGNALLVDGSQHQYAMSSRFSLSIPVPATRAPPAMAPAVQR